MALKEKRPADYKNAKKRLQAVPDLDGKKGQLSVPFPLADNKPFDLDGADLRGAQHKKIKIDTLVATQKSVGRKKVQRYMKQKGEFSSIPTLVKINDTHYIANGHHRCTADFFLGKKNVRANVMDIDSST